MSMFDNLRDKAQDVMNNPEQRAKIEEIAREKGLSLEEAKDHFLKTQDKDQDSPAP
jgi:hypothetical protein